MSFFGLGRGHQRFRWRGWEDFSPEPGQTPPTGQDAGDVDDYDYQDDRDWGGGSGPRGSLRGLELYHRSFSKRLETGPDVRLRIENRNGRINVRTHDEPAVVVDVQAEVYAASSQDADAEAARIERGISADANRVTVMVPDLVRPEWFFFGRGPRVDYDVSVPAGTDVWAVSRNGAINIVGTRGKARVEGRNGRITLEDIGGDVEAETHNGRFILRRCGASARITSRNGPIGIERVSGAIEVENRNGVIEVEDAGAGIKLKTHNGAIKVTSKVNGDIDLQAANGSVRLAVTPDSKFEIDAESVRGSTRSELPVRDRRPSEGAGPAHKVRIRTTNGSIRLTEA